MPSIESSCTAFRSVQDSICEFLAQEAGAAYREDLWDYAKGEGGGITRIWENGDLIEKGGVNYSAIEGSALPASAATQFKIPEDTPFVATGVSLVIHPTNPFVPTIHMNIRYFEAGDVCWFGGGIDLTPYYPKREQVIEFHCALKAICDESHEDYALFKKTCDDYFFIRHRGEARGVGGVFFDHLRENAGQHFSFVRNLGQAFPNLYRPLILANCDIPYSDAQREFQLHRRSRYVEFNLVYDRGTLFGLQSQGRIESILMSMPAVAHWKYDWKPEPGTPEAELTDFYLKPQDWVAMDEGGAAD